MRTDFSFAATGDSIIARRIHGVGDSQIDAVARLIRGADAAFTNLELVTPREPKIPAAEYGGIHLGMPPLVLDELRACGFNLYNLAHNHALDFTLKGLLDTMDELDSRDMVFAGAGMNLGEARCPAYLNTPGGRVALVAAASSFTTGAQAGRSRMDFPGRPGINPLRCRTEYAVTSEQLRQLREIDEALGTARVRRQKLQFGLTIEEQPHAYKFLDRAFTEADSPRVRTSPQKQDLREIIRWIEDAKRQADFVIMSLHCHQGPGGAQNSDEPAGFIVEAARAFVDAGADAFVGHGPHMLRGVEIYRGKPIFYSLGNFMFMCENIRRLPAEMYERYRLPDGATPADVFDFESRQEGGEPKAFHADERFWETVLPVCDFRFGKPAAITLYPVTLRLDEPRSRRGAPALAGGKQGRRILRRLSKLSGPFGTEILCEDGPEGPVGRMRL